MKTIRKMLLLLSITLILTGCELGKIDSNKYITFDGDELITLKINTVKKIAKQDENLIIIDLAKKYNWNEEYLYIRQTSEEDSTNRSYGLVYEYNMMFISLTIGTYSSIYDTDDETFFDDIYIDENREKQIINGVICYVSEFTTEQNVKAKRITFIKDARTYDISIYDFKDDYTDYVTKIYEAYR